jgi:7-cyano-7-deazaguanine synthase
MNRAKHAVGLLSGGLDSSVSLALAQAQGWTIDLALTFDYGQRAARAEKEHGCRVATALGIPFRHLRLEWFSWFRTGGALLSQSDALPRPLITQLDDAAFTTESAKKVWVPNRNGTFIEIAAGLAEDLGCEAVIVGFNREEAATFPDNSKAYLEAISQALRFSTNEAVRVISPTVDMNKSEIVAEAKRIDFPFNLLWSCYESAAQMCGRCESCTRLKRALSQSSETPLDSLFQDAAL